MTSPAQKTYMVNTLLSRDEYEDSDDYDLMREMYDQSIDEDRDPPIWITTTEDGLSVDRMREILNQEIQHRELAKQAKLFKPDSVVSAEYSIDGHYYPAVVLNHTIDDPFVTVRFLADGVTDCVHESRINPRPTFGMCKRDRRIWATGRVLTFNNKRYKF